MPKAYLTADENNHLNLHSYVFSGGYLYDRVEYYTHVSVRRIKEETEASKGYKSSENPDGWERVTVIVGGNK